MTTQISLGAVVSAPSANGQEDVEKLEFEPIKGYPMLRWRGKRPFRSTYFYPAQVKEVHGEEVDGWHNKIYWGDNLQVMSHLLKHYRGQVDLVYIDPPFDSKADYKKHVHLRGKSAWGDTSVFEEKQYTDIWTNDEYLQFVYERLILLKELLTDGGALFLHCDTKRNHYLRAIMDEVFGAESFRNELIRVKCNPKNSKRKAFGNIHDCIYFYVKGSESQLTWNPQREDILSEDLERIFEKVDSSGRRYTTVALHAPGERTGETGQPWRGVPLPRGRHWAFVHKTLDELDAEGRIEWSSSGVPRLIRYADEKEGDRVQDIWTMKDPQYAIYPTEKPERLVERIIRASTNPGALVLDCFMGSGTTQAVAMELGRRFIGVDINLGAIQTTTKRLVGVSRELSGKTTMTMAPPPTLGLDEEEAKTDTPQEPDTFYTGFAVYNVNHYEVFRNPVQARDLLLGALEIQELTKGHLFDGEKDGRLVKIMPVNRIATRADLTPLISGFDYRAFERRYAEDPRRPVEHITLVCMGHEPDLAAALKAEVKPYEIDVEVVDILRDRGDLLFKRDAEARINVQNGCLTIEAFYPMNLLQKLSLEKEKVDDWREMVDSVMIDWNYDGAIFTPALVDIPERNALVQGRYEVPADAGTIRVKITDVLSESLEVQVDG